MKCVVCGCENPPRAFTCVKCKVLLPQMENLSLSDALGSVFIKDEALDSMDGMNPSNFILLAKVEEALDLLFNGEITVEEFEAELQSALAPLAKIMDKIDELEDEQYRQASGGMELLIEGYNQFKDSIDEIRLFLETEDESYVERGLNMARESARILVQAISVGSEEMETSDIK